MATVLLTAAISLLPATSDPRQAQASVDDIKVSATDIPGDGATKGPSARE